MVENRKEVALIASFLLVSILKRNFLRISKSQQPHMSAILIQRKREKRYWCNCFTLKRKLTPFHLAKAFYRDYSNWRIFYRPVFVANTGATVKLSFVRAEVSKLVQNIYQGSLLGKMFANIERLWYKTTLPQCVWLVIIVPYQLITTYDIHGILFEISKPTTT